MGGQKTNKHRRKSKENRSNSKNSVDKLTITKEDGKKDVADEMNISNLNLTIAGSSSFVETSCAVKTSGFKAIIEGNAPGDKGIIAGGGSVVKTFCAEGTTEVKEIIEENAPGDKGIITGGTLNINGDETSNSTKELEIQLVGHAGTVIEANCSPPIKQEELSTSLPTIAVVGENMEKYISVESFKSSEKKYEETLKETKKRLESTLLFYAKDRLNNMEVEKENERLKDDQTKGNNARRKIMQSIEEKYKEDLVKATNETDVALKERNQFKADLVKVTNEKDVALKERNQFKADLVKATNEKDVALKERNQFKADLVKAMNEKDIVLKERSQFKEDLETIHQSHGITLESLRTVSAELQANKNDLEKSGEMINQLKEELKIKKDKYEKNINENKKSFEELLSKTKAVCRNLEEVNFSLTEELNSSKLDLIKSEEKLITAKQELQNNREDYEKCKTERNKTFKGLFFRSKEDFNKLKVLNLSLTEELDLCKLDLIKSDENLTSTKKELETDREDYERRKSERNKTFKGLLLRSKNSFVALQALNVSLTEDLNSNKLDLFEANVKLVKANKKIVKANGTINHLKSVVNDINETSISQQNEITMLKCQRCNDANTIMSLQTKVIEKDQKIEDVSNELEEVTKDEFNSRKIIDETFEELKASKLQIISKDKEMKAALERQVNACEDKIEKIEANHKTEIVTLETYYSTELGDLTTRFETAFEKMCNTVEKQKEEELRKVHIFYHKEIDEINCQTQKYADDAKEDKEEALRNVRHYFNDRIEQIINHNAENMKKKETLFSAEKEKLDKIIINANQSKIKFISHTRGYLDGKLSARRYTPWHNMINASKVIQLLDSYE